MATSVLQAAKNVINSRMQVAEQTLSKLQRSNEDCIAGTTTGAGRCVC